MATMDTSWLDKLEANITVCDAEGRVVYMNARSAEFFRDQGGLDLLGKTLWHCHQEPSNAKVRRIMETKKTKCYTIEKNGEKRLVWQAPILEGGVCGGIVEIGLPVPFEMEHFVRDKTGV